MSVGDVFTGPNWLPPRGRAITLILNGLVRKTASGWRAIVSRQTSAFAHGLVRIPTIFGRRRASGNENILNGVAPINGSVARLIQNASVRSNAHHRGNTATSVENICVNGEPAIGSRLTDIHDSVERDNEQLVVTSGTTPSKNGKRNSLSTEDDARRAGRLSISSEIILFR